jgi:hypothetical protein
VVSVERDSVSVNRHFVVVYTNINNFLETPKSREAYFQNPPSFAPGRNEFQWREGQFCECVGVLRGFGMAESCVLLCAEV